MELANIQKAIDDLIRKQNIACEELTVKQLAEAFKQALQCGDFQRHVVVGSFAQTVSYIPYREWECQKLEILKLKSALQEIKECLERACNSRNVAD